MQCQPYTLQSRLLNANILIMDNKETVFYLGEKDKSGDIRFQLIIVMLFAIGIPSWIVMIMSGVNIALALILPALFIAFCAVALKLNSASFKRKEEELAMMLRDIKEEHDSLEKEHDELLLEIKKLTDF